MNLTILGTSYKSNQTVFVSIYKEIQPVHPKGDQSWVFIGRTDAEAETPILWPPHVKSWLTGKDPDAGRDWGREEKGMTEDEMAGWHHRLYGHEFEWTLGVGDRQGDLVCCDSWGHEVLDMTERLNWTELNWSLKSKQNSHYCGFSIKFQEKKREQEKHYFWFCFIVA